ncbi:MAG: RecX family transcriptional regulator [Candidatus Wallbacteria bacterium]|nr:RecX family transcriptional regulator [Candidatus Wallbacteria bacterium]
MHRSCREFALKLFTSRDYSSYELRRKLASAGFSFTEINCALEELDKLGLLDDERVLSEILYKTIAKKPVGRERLLSLLDKLGVPLEKAQEIVKLFPDGQLITLALNYLKKNKLATDRKKTLNFLRSGCFSEEEGRTILDELGFLDSD